MIDVKNLNIWKPETKQNCNNDYYLDSDITELNLSVRSFNCLKRANCNTIRDIYNYIGEEGHSLKKIRNLGERSEREILEKLEEYRLLCEKQGCTAEKKKETIIKPARRIWDREIDEFPLSQFALNKLKACGIRKIGDLYATNPKNEPGWYAVRELFEKIPSCR